MSSTIKLLSQSSTVLHFVGTYAIAMTLLSFGVHNWHAFLIAIAAAFVWEVLDYLNAKHYWNYPVLDPKGADFFDFMVDAAGAGTALLLGVI